MKNKILILVFALIVAAIGAQQDIPKSKTEKGISPQTISNQQILANNTYAVVVGISDYQDPGIPDLRFADKDAEAFANYLRSNAGGILDNDHLKVLINQQATMAQFANVLDWLMENTKEGDRAIIYFSGHGDVEKRTLTQPGFLLCWDAPARVYMAGGAFALPMLQEVVSTLSIQNKAKVIVITDACRSGKLAGSSVGGAQATASNLAKQFGNEIKIMSCQPNEYSIEGEQWGGGRGAFSFHLIDAFYGLADSNDDHFVTLQEIGRYLEDHVSNEVAPVSQVPMIVGDRNERMTDVEPSTLAALKSGKTNQILSLSAVEAKGIEEEVLSKLDSNTINIYNLFKSTIKNKHFFDPVNACANGYFESLIHEPKLERLHSSMKRNYAAALQNEAQQSINIWLEANVNKLACLEITLNMAPIPRQLKRAAELLGSNHYMYKTLKARQYLFEAYTDNMNNYILDTLNGNRTIALYKQALELEPNSAIPHYLMCGVYCYNLKKLDSAYYHFKEATRLAPAWILPYASFAEYYFEELYDYKNAKKILSEGYKVDSTHGFILADFMEITRKEHKYDEALKFANKYEAYGGETFPCYYSTKAFIYYFSHQYEEANKTFEKGLAMNFQSAGILSGAGYFYTQMKRFAEAKTLLEKSLSMDNNYVSWSSMGNLYTKLKQFAKAKEAIDESISLNSNYYFAWYHKGELNLITNQINEAERAYQKAIAIDSQYVEAHVGLAKCYLKRNLVLQAKAQLNIALSIDAKNEEMNLSYAKLLIQENHMLLALNYVEQSIKYGTELKVLIDDQELNQLKELPEWNVMIDKYFVFAPKVK